MRRAISARVYVTLGATLIAVNMSNLALAEKSTSSANGISGGDVQGISGGDVLGISGGDIQGISGGDALGISGGDRLLLAGPVTSIDRMNGVFESMGQNVMVSQSMLSGMSVGDYVSVDGSVAAPGWLYADAVSISNRRYVPGSTEMFARVSLF